MSLFYASGCAMCLYMACSLFRMQFNAKSRGEASILTAMIVVMLTFLFYMLPKLFK